MKREYHVASIWVISNSCIRNFAWRGGWCGRKLNAGYTVM